MYQSTGFTYSLIEIIVAAYTVAIKELFDFSQSIGTFAIISCFRRASKACPW